MIEQSASPANEPPFEFRLRPDRSITAAGLAVFFLVLVATSVMVAGFSAWQGNLFAPVFAALELTLVWLLLRYVWRRQGQLQERIALTREALTVARQPPGDEVSFHPYWVRIVRDPEDAGTARRRLLLTSHGRTVEVGAFLGDDERGQLERLLVGALGALRDGTGSGTARKASG
ncbi:MAG: DUF2244 domain-containing protein [Xanthomonadaceae bacterium]|jgi:uncharacterized membrane protein|nr:DUF2244 domain-containing protein [Xanthomonadaceae bacterium]